MVYANNSSDYSGTENNPNTENMYVSFHFIS